MKKGTKFQIRSDAAKQRWVRDDRKEAFWRGHIQAWKVSGLSKRGYCLKNNLSQSSFNAWNREITIRDREKVPSLNVQELLGDEGRVEANPFVPLRLLDSAKPTEQEIVEQEQDGPEPEESSVQPLSQAVEVVVPGGAVIRVGSGCDLKFIGELFSTLKGRTNAEH